jgi:hypothetical protein
MGTPEGYQEMSERNKKPAHRRNSLRRMQLLELKGNTCRFLHESPTVITLEFHTEPRPANKQATRAELMLGTYDLKSKRRTSLLC